MNSDRHPCSCCGYRTLPLPAGGTMEICPVCFWEDVGDACWTHGQLPLAEAQREFLSHGAASPEFQNSVRPPLPEEARSDHWLSLEEMRHKIIRFIEEAFAKVQLDEGMSLAQQELLDDWHTDAQFQAAAAPPTLRWEEISDDTLSHLRYLTLNSLDPGSIRFHLPAFLRFTLTSDRNRNLCHNLIFYDLEKGPESTEGGFHLLTKSQRESVAAFLCFYERHEQGEAKEATQGLKAGWDQWIPDFVRIAYL
ncbi:MAG: CPCC family cysteine-rich protein [Luteolibacter sp.]